MELGKLVDVKDVGHLPWWLRNGKSTATVILYAIENDTAITSYGIVPVYKLSEHEGDGAAIIGPDEACRMTIMPWLQAHRDRCFGTGKMMITSSGKYIFEGGERNVLVYLKAGESIFERASNKKFERLLNGTSPEVISKINLKVL